MERKMWLVLPFSMHLVCFFLTQILVPMGVATEMNPISNFVYMTTGSFLLVPIYAFVIFFFIVPKMIDFYIRFTKTENKRGVIEYVFIGLTTIMMTVNLYNDVMVYINVSQFL